MREVLALLFVVGVVFILPFFSTYVWYPASAYNRARLTAGRGSHVLPTRSTTHV